MDLPAYYKKIKSVAGLGIQIAKAEFKLRNEGSFLGVFWYLLNPILTFVLLFLVFNDRLGIGIKYYALYLLLGVIMFNFFQSSTFEASYAIKTNSGIIKSINFPKESLVLGIIFKNIFSHILEIILFFSISAFLKISFIGIFYYFFILFFFCLFVFGFSLALSSFTVYFFDLDNVWSFAARMLWLATPIFYSISGQTRLLYANLFNPLYYFISVARDLVIYNKMPESWLALGLILWSFGFLALGLFVFNKLKNKFSELI